MSAEQGGRLGLRGSSVVCVGCLEGVRESRNGRAKRGMCDKECDVNVCVVEAGRGCLPECGDAGRFVVCCVVRVRGRGNTDMGWESGTFGLLLNRGLMGTGLRQV